MDDRNSITVRFTVRFSFVITGITAYVLVGYQVAFWVAARIVPDAADFYRQGGSIQTDRLDSFYLLGGLGVCAAACVGAMVGNGFYIAWERR